MAESFRPTAKQQEAIALLGSDAKHIMAFGGSRSGKTFMFVRALVIRALAAPGSRHAILRFRFNHVKASIVLDTFPKVMSLCFPQVEYRIDHTDWFAELPNKSQIWFGGLDEKERTEKILGQEHATIFPNECSQIPWSSIALATTRLAQKVMIAATGKQLRLKMYYDCNPPSQAHWTYKLFTKRIDPETNKPLSNPDDYASIQVNPRDNLDNLPAGYLDTLAALPARMRTRFLDGKFGDVTEGALWSVEMIDKWRSGSEPLPDMQRIVIGVDPSGAGDEDNAGNDEIGIVVVGLGLDGVAYVLEDLTCKAGPLVWGRLVVNAYDRHSADLIVAEKNFGGEMVRFVIQSAKQGIPCKMVTASRGKAVRAEPIASLTEQGKIRFAGTFPRLEDELCSFTTYGYMGGSSPNRADALIWAMSEVFPGIVSGKDNRKPLIDMTPKHSHNSEHAWLR